MSVLQYIKNKVRSWFTWKGFKRILIQGLIFIILSELLIMFIAKQGWINCEVPNYSLASYKNFVGHYDKDVGLIHVPNSSSYFTRGCFDFEMYCNQQGFRDRDRDKHSKSVRFLFLGDSFTEGFGVDSAHRFTNVLESDLKVECLNFGVSGKGTTQHQEIYRKFGLQYDHDVVVVQLYPTNDFLDDQPVQEGRGDRPYWVKRDTSWQLLPPLSRPIYTYKMPGYKQWLRSYSYLFNGVKYAKGALYSWNGITDYYWEFEDEQLERMLRSMKEIRMLAGERQVIVMTLPSMVEMDRPGFASSPLVQELTAFCKEMDIQYLDLATELEELNAEERHNLYLSCDGHLSEKGHRFVAKLLGGLVD